AVVLGGVLSLGLAARAYAAAAPAYAARVTLASGEVMVAASGDARRVAGIVDAVNRAIADRR
ncbi:MAG: hypothetical protein JWO31_2748, partial [Phycisphaerales bacterium]|nr:hypothetical protein [Phycisphaerales bacterium]